MSCVLDETVLVLNRNFQPVHVIGVRDAMRLVVSDKAQVVDDEYRCYNTLEWAAHSSNKTDNIIRTVTRQFAVPEVIRLLEFDKRVRYTINYTRENIFFRDDYQCQYCGTRLARRDVTIDHVIPRSRQMDFNLTPQQIQAWDNVVCSCRKCNARKADKTPREANMHLLKEPTRPDWLGQVRGLHPKNTKASWQTYLDVLKGKAK